MKTVKAITFYPNAVELKDKNIRVLFVKNIVDEEVSYAVRFKRLVSVEEAERFHAQATPSGSQYIDESGRILITNLGLSVNALELFLAALDASMKRGILDLPNIKYALSNISE